MGFQKTVVKQDVQKVRPARAENAAGGLFEHPA